MPRYLATLCHADGRTGSVQRTRWWAEDADAVRAGFRWLRLHVHAAGLVHPHFDRWTVARYDERGLPIIIAYGGIDDDPDRSGPEEGAQARPDTSREHVHIDLRKPRG